MVLTNSGDAAQDLSGWELRSDPEASELFDLRDLGTDLAPGASNTIQSGPSASGAFIWTTDEVFRDNDPTDYVRLVDNTGATVDQVNCPASETVSSSSRARKSRREARLFGPLPGGRSAYRRDRLPLPASPLGRSREVMSV